MTEEPQMPFPIGAVVRRKFKKGRFYHYGIASEYYHPDTGLQMIYQFGGPFEGEPGTNTLRLSILNRVWAADEGNHTGYHIGVTDYITFAEKREIEVVEVPEDPYPVIQRAKSLMHRSDYNLLTRNCEHYANFAFHGTWSSNQADNLTVGTVLDGVKMIFGSIFKKDGL